MVLYKSKETNIDNVIVEDTSLKIEGANFFGTQIKDYWEDIEFDTTLHGRKAIWEVSVCLSTNDKFYISTGKTEGILQYPALEDAYHFNKVLAVYHEDKLQHFGALTHAQRQIFSPRIKAIDNLKKALESENFSSIVVLDKKDVINWTGQYQEPKKIKLKM